MSIFINFLKASQIRFFWFFILNCPSVYEKAVGSINMTIIYSILYLLEKDHDFRVWKLIKKKSSDALRFWNIIEQPKQKYKHTYTQYYTRKPGLSKLIVKKLSDECNICHNNIIILSSCGHTFFNNRPNNDHSHDTHVLARVKSN